MAAECGKQIHVELDIGNLCVYNLTLLKGNLQKNTTDEELKNVASLGAQKLLNEIYKIPIEHHEHIPVVKLPEGVTVLPREKHIPKAKALTKWEEFAKAKGIQTRKKDKLIWDETTKEWKPRFGYKSIKNSNEDWLIEVPENGEANADYFGKVKKEKKERIAKNEYQRLKNIASSQKLKVTNLESVDRADKDQLLRSAVAAKAATASLGRFQAKISKEKQPKQSGKKRQFKPNYVDGKVEKENNLKIIHHIEFKKPKLNVAEAVQKYTMKSLKQGKSDEKRAADERKKKSKKNKFIKNIYRGGKIPISRKKLQSTK